jgi:hypothetical protein
VKHNAQDIGDWKLSEMFYEGYTGLKWIKNEMEEIRKSG